MSDKEYHFTIAANPSSIPYPECEIVIDASKAAVNQPGQYDFSKMIARIGMWAQKTFGPTPLQVHAARMNEEMSDVLNAAAIGDVRRMGRALAGVLVVAGAIAHSENIDLAAALEAEQDDNEAAQWRRTAWGHWIRQGDGDVKVDDWAMLLVNGVREGCISVRRGVVLLTRRGAKQSAAWDFLKEQGVATSEDQTIPAPQDLTPAGRHVFGRISTAAVPRECAAAHSFDLGGVLPLPAAWSDGMPSVKPAAHFGVSI